jgi:regulator of sigma D
MDDEILDKTLVHIDSSSVEFQGNDKWIFNVNLLEPLRDVVYIMILKTEVTLIKTKNSDQEDVFKINYNELGKNTYGLDSYPIHIHLNDFKRHSCVVSKFASDTLTLGSDLVQKLNTFVDASGKTTILGTDYDKIIGEPPAESNIQHVAINPTLNRIGDTYIISDAKIYFDKLKHLRDGIIVNLKQIIEDTPDEGVKKRNNEMIIKIQNLTDPLINAFTKFYERVVENDEKHIAKYFEHIPVNINNVLTTTQDILTFGNQVFATFHRNNQNVHVLNPIEPNLQRLNFELRDKYDNPIDKNNISQFNMTLCFYQNGRKISRG